MNDPAKTKTLALRNSAISIFQAGVLAADPYKAVHQCLKTDQNQSQIWLTGLGESRTGNWSLIHLIAVGKAACAMIKAAIDIIPSQLIGNAVAVTNYENKMPVDGVKVLAASHPLPDEAGFKAAKQCYEVAERAKTGELVLVMVSGGGSALIPYPVKTVTLQEKIHTTALLLACGANINEINCVRKHLSQIKGGGLARIATPADCHALILSDVIGDDLSTIASGPTIPDESTFNDAINILMQKNIWHSIPESVRHHLENGQQGKVKETPKPDDPIFTHCDFTLIGSNSISVNAIMTAANDQGFETILYSENVCGEARVEAEKLVHFAKQRINETGNQPIAILAGGESTVILKGIGKGGRNQEMALAFASHAEKEGLAGNWVFLSGGTDGRDGPTNAAGGLVDSGTIQRILDTGMNPATLLAKNDSYTALKASNDLLMTGATGTNVADLQVLLIKP